MTIRSVTMTIKTPLVMDTPATGQKSQTTVLQWTPSHGEIWGNGNAHQSLLHIKEKEKEEEPNRNRMAKKKVLVEMLCAPF